MKLTHALCLMNPDYFLAADTLQHVPANEGMDLKRCGHDGYMSAMDKAKQTFPGCRAYEIDKFLFLQCMSKPKSPLLTAESRFFQISTNAYDSDCWEDFEGSYTVYADAPGPGGSWDERTNGGDSGSAPYPLTEPAKGDVILVRTGVLKGRAIGVVDRNDYAEPRGLNERSRLHVSWINKSQTDCGKLLEAMNRRIAVLLDREHQIGHTYFLGVDTLAALASTFQNRIIPLLQEYFYDDWEKIRAVLNENEFVQQSDPPEELVRLDLVDSGRAVLQAAARPGRPMARPEGVQDDLRNEVARGRRRNGTGRLTMPTVSEHDHPADLRDPNGRYPPPTGRPRRAARRSLVVREYESLTGLNQDEQRDLERFARVQWTDAQSQRRPVLTLRNGQLYAENYVGIIETWRGTVIEILPKVDLSNAGDDTRGARHTGEQTDGSTGLSNGQDEDTKRVFLTMLRDWRGLGEAQFDAAGIRAIRRLDMLEAFVHLFLTNVVQLTRRDLARAYRTREANLPCLRGRILFPPHVRENLVDRSRFYVGYDEFTADRPANRLIHLALRRLVGIVRHPVNRQRLHQLRIVFSGVPPPRNLDDDWARHRVDRSMRHYDRVMPWVGLFLFGQGLATLAGPYVNRALLFPMEEVFEDFRHRGRPAAPAPVHGVRPGPETASGHGRHRQALFPAEAGHRPDGPPTRAVHP